MVAIYNNILLARDSFILVNTVMVETYYIYLARDTLDFIDTLVVEIYTMARYSYKSRLYLAIVYVFIIYYI